MADTHQVLYRKYRPRDFSEVVGQEHVVRPVTNAIRMGKVAHAYLFSGPRGVGKTTVARLIAKAVNCSDFAPPRSGEPQNRAPVDLSAKALASAEAFLPAISLATAGAKADNDDKEIPCNSCDLCVAFNEGRVFDLIEIDAASNRGIDEIRELREAVRFVPAGGNKKTYIIDECHMLTKEAFSALLKTLEEPPAHAIFVLATTELDKVPATIVSRTQHYAFRRPQISEIADRLQHIAGREGMEFERRGAYMIASLAEGSLRDAESIFGKVCAVADKKISEEDIVEILGMPRRAVIREMITSMALRDGKRALELVDELSRSGHEYEYAVKSLIQYFRSMLLLRLNPAFTAIIAAEMPEEDILFLKERGDQFPDLRIRHALATLIGAFMNFKKSPIPQLPLELALLEIIQKE